MEYQVKLTQGPCDNVSSLADKLCFIEINPLDYDLSFEELMDVNVINKIIKDYNATCEELGEDYAIEEELPEDADILNNIKTISIEFDDDMAEYLKQNPCIANYDVIISNEVKLNHEDFNTIKDNFEGFKSVKVNIEGNNRLVPFSEYEQALHAIDKIIEPIKKYDLSPFEQVMFAYDLVRDRVYVKEEKGEDPRLSRDLSKVLTGDKIVCAGFTEVLAAVLDELGIKNNRYLICNDDKSEAHIRNRIFIDDKKYRIHGLYHFDATYDCKRAGSSNDHTMLYSNFALTEKERQKCDGNNWSPFRTIVLDEELINKAKSYIDKAESGDYEFEVYELAPLMNQLSVFSKMFLNDMIFDRFKNAMFRSQFNRSSIEEFDYDKLRKALDKVIKMYNAKEIPLATLTNLFINVRSIENKEDPIKYPFNSTEIINMVSTTKRVNPEELLVDAIFGTGNKERIDRAKKIRKKVIDQVKKRNIPVSSMEEELVRTR